jgi:predicted glycoside hydrolase/deacetylase ChbG (UPF0249 family)
MVRESAAAEASRYARRNPQLSLGLHFDFGEWEYHNGDWLLRYEVVPIDNVETVRAEARHQLDRFRQLTGRDPTHLDSHQHIHRRGTVREALVDIAAELGVPLRHCTTGIQYCGAFFGQCNDGSPNPSALSVEGLIDILEPLPLGTTELGCHPGWPEDVASCYRLERAREVQVLCDPRAAAAVRELGFRLASFASI